MQICVAILVLGGWEEQAVITSYNHIQYGRIYTIEIVFQLPILGI